MEKSLNGEEATLGRLIQSIRRNYSEEGSKPDTQAICAEKIGISRSLLALIEAGQRIAKDEQLQKLAFAYGKTREERDYLLRELRKAALRQIDSDLVKGYDPSIADHLPKASQGEFLPVDLQILIKDRASRLGIPDVRLAEAAGLTMEEFWRVMAGALPISHKGIEKLARCLGEDPESWLIFAGYIPPGLREKLQVILKRGGEHAKASASALLETQTHNKSLDSKPRSKKK